MLLTGAALIREREHGTIEHLLVMPVNPSEIMVAKIWANGLAIVVAAILSLWIVVQTVLAVPIAGSIPLFIFGAVLYLVSVTGLGILLATFTTSMPQFGLLALPVLVVMNLLSGSTTPMESMPVWLQNVMQLSPSTHFVAFSQAILYRGAGIDIVWPRHRGHGRARCGLLLHRPQAFQGNHGHGALAAEPRWLSSSRRRRLIGALTSGPVRLERDTSDKSFTLSRLPGEAYRHAIFCR